MTEDRRAQNHLRALRGLQAYRRAEKKNQDAQERQQEKRASRQRSATAAPRLVARTPTREDEVKPKNAKDVETWFREGHWRRIGKKVVVSKWTIPQLTLASRLLIEYGDELTYKGVQSFFENFDAFAARQRGKVWIEPTINLLWAMRESVFLQVQTKGIKAKVAAESRSQGRQHVAPQPSDPKNSDEYRPMKLRSNLGWND